MSDMTQLNPLTFVATSDLSAVTKGRTMPSADFVDGATVGWVPANLGIGASGHIVDQIPFGATGDLRLRPDPASRHEISGVAGKPDVTVVMADIVGMDGSAWGCCPRTFLRDAVADLQSEFGLSMLAAFEHEFIDLQATGDHHPFSWSNFRAAEPIGSQVMTAMAASALAPENWLPEYGTHQYEVTVRPTGPVASADRAILTRDLVRDVFSAAGHRASFSPVVRPGEAGNGVHAHFGLHDNDAKTALFDPARPGRLSELGGRFAAGIVRYAPAMTAIFAPLTISYQRLVPNQWSTARAFLGLHNREALLRVCPTVEIGGKDPGPQLHFEFRGGDIGANPWLLLGSVIRAGLEGLRQDMDPAEVIAGELDLQGRHADLPRLPNNLGAALDAYQQDETVTGWFDNDLVTTYLRIKRVELEELSPMSLAEQCDWYARVY